MLIAPSMLAADFAHLESELKKITVGGADWVHLDIMDGVFVPNISMGIPVVEASLHKPSVRRSPDDNPPQKVCPAVL